MLYLTYEEYNEMGGMLDLTAFSQNISRACLMIDNHTHGRLRSFESIPQEVKMLCRDLVEYITMNTVQKPFVSSRSQSAGGVSESESYTVKSVDEYANDIESMMIDYLSQVKTGNGISVLYRGALS